MYLILRFFQNERIEDGIFERKGENNIKYIKSKFPDIGSLKLDEINKAIAIYIDKAMGEKRSIEIGLKDFVIEDNRIHLRFNIIRDMEFTCKELNSGLYGTLMRNGVLKKGEMTPYLALIKDSEWNNVIRVRTRLKTHKYMVDEEKLVQLKKENNWEGIYNYYGSVEEILNGNSDICDDILILKEIGFAASKLAAVGPIPRDIRQDRKKKEDYLALKRKYRDNAEKIYKRCIEFEPQSASNYSNLGFLYYNNVLDLTTPGGRRDGNAKKEYEKAVEYIEKALSLDNTRVKDLYRIGYLYTEKAPAILKYSGDKQSLNNEDTTNIEKIIQKGISYFEQAIGIWESLDDENETYSKKKSTKKEYLKALFNSGKAYQSLYERYWRKVVNYSVLFDLSMDEIRPLNKQSKVYIERAKNNYEKCFFSQCGNVDVIENEDFNYINGDLKNWKLEGVDMLYRLGTVYLDLYWFLVSIETHSERERQDYLNKSISYLNSAKKCLRLALKVNWKEKSTQNKKYVEERLARLYISSGKYKDAIKIIRRHSTTKDYYIINTLGLAYYLDGEYEEAVKILRKIWRDKNNMDRNRSRMILAMSLYKLSKYTEAINILKGIYNDCQNLPTWETRLKTLIDDCDKSIWKV